MKTIALKSFLKTGNTYEIGLGNGTIHHFTNAKAANKFLSDTNKFLNDQLFTLNQIVIEIYPHIRTLWMLNDKYQFDRTASQFLDNIEHHLKQTVLRSSSKNGTYYVFIDMRKCCHALKMLIKHLQQFSTIKSTDTIRRYQLNGLFERVQTEYMNLENYSLISATTMINISRYEDQIELQFQLKAMA
jgi:hypothetical protein